MPITGLTFLSFVTSKFSLLFTFGDVFYNPWNLSLFLITFYHILFFFVVCASPRPKIWKKLWNNFSYFQLLFLSRTASAQLCMIFHRPLQYSFLFILFWILQIKGYKNPRILVGTLFYMVYYMRTTIKHKQCQEKTLQNFRFYSVFCGIKAPCLP